MWNGDFTSISHHNKILRVALTQDTLVETSTANLFRSNKTSFQMYYTEESLLQVFRKFTKTTMMNLFNTEVE